MDQFPQDTPKTGRNGEVIIPIVEESSSEMRNVGQPEEASGQDYESKYLRAMADLDNLRKQTGRRIDEARLSERQALLLGFIEVIDSIERALDAHGAEGNPWLEGIEAIQQQMLGILGQYDARPFDAIGEAFSPQRHHAVATVDLPGRPPGTVVDVTQAGYVMGEESILRPAQVIVTK